MPCITLTIESTPSPSPPTSGMVITNVQAKTWSIPGDVSVSWEQSIFGAITMTIDDSTSEFYWGTHYAGRNEIKFHDVSAGTHKFCVSPR